MIDEHKDSICRIFFCYRAAGSETAKNIKSYLKSIKNKEYGRVWYSDDENVGNFSIDIIPLISQAEIFVLFLAPGFTDYFLTPNGDLNLTGYNQMPSCITVREICEIEKQRQKRNITILTVNIDQYAFSDHDLQILEEVFRQANILRDDTIKFYKDLNRNIYLRRQTDLPSFTNRLMNGLEEKQVIKADTNQERITDFYFLTIISEEKYQEYFQSLFKQEKYPIIKFFGYTGEVLSSDLLSYSNRYSLDIELRILQRNYIIEEKDESQHNAKLPKGIRPWNKAKAIKQMCFESWNFSLKRTIKYYSHQPFLKGCLFCNDSGRAIIGMINFQKWEPLPLSGGSVFKSVPSDMLLINSNGGKEYEAFLERINSQFEYEWAHALTQQEMKQYKETGDEVMKKEKPSTIILDFDRTLVYLYRNEQLLFDLAKIICNYYSNYLSIDPSLYTIDGYKAWYYLHQLTCNNYEYEDAFEINNKAEQLVTDFESHVIDNTNFLENVIETLNKLHQDGFELMIVSSNSSKIIKKALNREGILSFFSQVMGRPIPFDPSKIKPSAYPIEQALIKTTSEKHKVWYVGDDIVDIDSAKACDIISVGVASGKYSLEQLEKHEATYVIKQLSDIYNLLN